MSLWTGSVNPFSSIKGSPRFLEMLFRDPGPFVKPLQIEPIAGFDPKTAHTPIEIKMFRPQKYYACTSLHPVTVAPIKKIGRNERHFLGCRRHAAISSLSINAQFARYLRCAQHVIAGISTILPAEIFLCARISPRFADFWTDIVCKEKPQHERLSISC
jgi:hypothetical protein